MISFIRVKNYAVIDEIEIEFEPGFTVMTGETGAGKSILVDALGLVLGDRADASAVRHGTPQAEISVLFDCPSGHPAHAWLEERGLDDEQSCALRRLISAEGRSRAFVNSQPVTLQDLRILGALLVDIHGQHAHQSLLHSAQQRRLLDSTGQLDTLAQSVADAFALWRTKQSQYERSVGSKAERESQIELLTFQLAEMEDLGLAAGELEELQTEHGRLANVDELARGVQDILELLYESEQFAAHGQLVNACRHLEQLSEHDESLRGPATQLRAVEIEVRDVAAGLTHYRDRLEPDPERLEAVETRLGRIRTLARRHKVEESALHELAGALRRMLDGHVGDNQSLQGLEQAIEEARAAYVTAARRLSAERNSHAALLGKRVNAQLKQLGMAEGKFRVSIQERPPERYGASGIDDIEFEVRLNPGQPFAALSRVASGGELSRLSLALEVVDAGNSAITTYVFDEVDAGIGGGVAEIVGNRLRRLAGAHQVLCVTHLPQVASQGQHHLKITKLSDGRTSRTNIRRLTRDERVEELSRMLGGVQITDRTRAHAEEMISKAGDPTTASGSG